MCQIVLPVFMVNHWGLIYVNFADKHLYFDDGLTAVVPPTALPFVKDALGLLFKLCPQHPSLQTKFWYPIQQFMCFGMPSQLPVNNKMIGFGSCGIGVIMAARDFMRNGPATVNNIKWRYSNMHKHRKELMLQIIRWAGYNRWVFQSCYFSFFNKPCALLGSVYLRALSFINPVLSWVVYI